MAFFDNLGKKASETSAKAIRKAKELTEITKLNSMISDEEKRVSSNYQQIGKLYTSMHPQDHEAVFAGMIAAVSESEEKIREYRRQIQDIKGVQLCGHCGAEVARGVAFCGSCGTPMEKVPSVSENTFVKCGNCGTVLQKDAQFCTACGQPTVKLTENSAACTESATDKAGE